MWHDQNNLILQSVKDTMVAPPQSMQCRHTARWQAAARVGWVGVAVIVLNLFILGLPLRYTQLVAPPATMLSALTHLGLSAQSSALVVLGMESIVVGMFTMAALVLFWHRSDAPMVFFVALMLLLLGVMNGLFVRRPWALAALYPALGLLCRVLAWAAYTLFVLFFFLFPDGRFTPRWMAWLVVPFVLLVTVWIFAPQTNFFTTDWGTLLTLPVVIPLLGCLTGLQIYRYMHFYDAIQQQQLRWVVFGVAGSIIGFLESAFVLQMGGDDMVLFATIFVSLLMLLIPFSFGIAVTRYRLFDIDLFINRALVYGILTACVVVGYGLLVGLFSQVVQTSGNVLISLIATGAIAVAFQPLRVSLQRMVNRLMFGERANPYAVISHLAQRLESTLAPDAALPTIVQTIKDALKVQYVAIALKQGQAFTVAATAGEPHPTPLAWPLSYQHEIVGQLLLAPRAGDEFGPADRHLIDDLARQAGVVVHAVQLTRDLQRANADLHASRERLITLREEERRRIRRDLHDGLGPALASLTFKLDAARNLLRRDLDRADALLASVTDTTQTAITDIRRLVYDLRPPVLDQLGLCGAVRELAVQQQTCDIAIMVDTPRDLPPLPAAIEVAAYRIVQEAMTNVIKHAQAQTCTIQLGLRDAVLIIDVHDDGRGLPSRHQYGVGRHAMRERAEELGGVCTIEADIHGGTVVHGELPLGGSQWNTSTL